MTSDKIILALREKKGFIKTEDGSLLVVELKICGLTQNVEKFSKAFEAWLREGQK